MKKIFAIAAILLSCCLGVGLSQLGGNPAKNHQIKLIMGNVTSVSAKNAGEKFKSLVEQYSDNTISVDLFPDNQLGDDKTVVEDTQLGDIDIAVSSTSSLSTMYKDFYLFDTPYLFLNSGEVYDVGFHGESGKAILKNMDSVGLYGMAMWENGFRNFTNNSHPVALPKDLKGMKIRTMENEVHLKAWSAFGANPTPMAFSELFTALQQGTVDGEENPIGIIESNRFYEVQKYISLTEHVYTPYCVVMNPKRYQSLNGTQRSAVDRAMKEATEYQIEQSNQLSDQAIESMKQYGCQVISLTDEEKQQYQKIVEDAKIFDLVKRKMKNPELFDRMQRELTEYREGKQ